MSSPKLRPRFLTRSAAIALTLSGMLAGCGGGDSSAGLSLSGILSIPSLQSLNVAHGFISGRGARGLTLQVDPSTLTIACFDTAKSPTLEIDGTVAADGTFSLDLTAASGDPVNCNVLDSSSAVVATMIFSGTGSTMDGSSLTYETFSLQSGVDLGTINVNLLNGEALADGTLLGNAAKVAVSDAYDFTGTWTISNLDSADVPKGFTSICTQAQADQERIDHPSGPRTCEGPVAGMSIYLKRLTGKSFTPDSTCADKVTNHTFASSDSCGGTTGDDDVFGIMIWQSESAFSACGSRLGFTYDQGKAFANVDLTGSGVTSGAPVWSTTWTDGSNVVHNISDGWKLADATAQWDVWDGGAYEEGGVSFWRQWDAGRAHYQLGLQEGGCTKDSDGTPFQPDWNSVDQNAWTCPSNSTVTVGGRTLYRNTCQNSSGGTAFTCTNTGGQFTAAVAGTSAPSDAAFMGTFNSNILVHHGDACIDDGTLPSLQCLTNAYYNGPGQGEGGSGCLRELRTDWSATTPDRFLIQDGPAKSKAEFVLEKLNYNNASAASFRQVEHDFRGVQSKGQWINCDVQKVTTISFAKQASGVVRVKFVTNSILNDSKDACVAAKTDLGIGTSFKIFDMTKN